MAKQRTVRQQHIEQVAGIILASGLTLEQAREINNGAGWSFDIRYDHETYSQNWFTRREGVSLMSADLEAAFTLSERWDRGDFTG